MKRALRGRRCEFFEACVTGYCRRADAQFATRARVQTSDAPLLVGNYLDARRLSSFSGELRVDPASDQTPYYALEGLIDELRISSVARTEFPETGGR